MLLLLKEQHHQSLGKVLQQLLLLLLGQRHQSSMLVLLILWRLEQLWTIQSHQKLEALLSWQPRRSRAPLQRWVCRQ